MKFIFIANKKEVSFFPIWLLISLLVLVFSIFYWVFPNTLLSVALRENLSSVMRLNYLTAYQAQHPKDAELMLRKLGTKLTVGRIKDFDKDMALFRARYPGSNDEINKHIRWFEYLVIRYRISKSNINDPNRFFLLKEARILRSWLAKQPLFLFQFQRLAQDALASGQAKLALKIYVTLFDQNKLSHIDDLEEGASIALQNNKPEISARFYEAAFARANTLPLKSKLAIACMQAWWVANKVEHALAWGLALPEDIRNTPAIQFYITRLALANNQPELAEQYFYQALKLPPNDPIVLDKELPRIANYEPILLLLYQVNLYNKHIQSAYRIAQVGVKRYPNTFIWHKQFAQTALWTQHFNQSMRQWLYIFNRFPKPEIRQEALKIAQQVGFQDVVIRMLRTLLKENPNDMHASIELAYAQNRIGNPNQSILVLRGVIAGANLSNKKQRKELKRAYTLKARIYTDMEQWKNALQTYQERDRLFGLDAASLLAQAQIYLHLNQPSMAEAVLKKGMHRISSKQNEYWYYLSNLAWRFNDRKASLIAFQHSAHQSDSLIQLIALNMASSPQTALTLSIQSFKQYPLKIFLGNALTLIAALHQWPTYLDLLHSLTPERKQEAEQMPLYWKLLAQLYGIHHNEGMQTSILRYAIRQFSDNASFKLDLFWFYLNQGRSDAVKQLLRRWYPEELTTEPGLWQAMAEGWSLENQLNAAIALYQNEFAHNIRNKNARCQANRTELSLELQQMVDYASLLQKNKDEVDAYDLRKNLWPWLLQHYVNLKPPVIPHQLFEQLAPFFTSGTVQWWLTLGLLYDRLDDQSLSLAINWFLQNNVIDWVVWMKHTYPVLNLPDKITLAVALYQNDTQTLQNIQANPEQTKPRNEHIQAAIRLENTAAAETLSFEEMRERNDAHEVYKDFVPLALHDANRVGGRLEKELFVNIGGRRERIDGQYRLTNEWKVKPFFAFWNSKSLNTSQIINVPQDKRAGATFEQKIHRGMVEYQIMYRDALNGFVPIDIKLRYDLAPNWHAIFNAGISQENFQTSNMRIGGAQDILSFDILGAITPYVFFNGQLEGLRYHSQNRHYLGDGLGVHGFLNHKFWLSYPDFSLGLFADLYFLRKNGTLGGDVLTLFPPLSPEVLSSPSLLASALNFEYQQLIPPSYYQAGFQFSFGDDITEYTSRLRPYFTGRGYYNTLTKLSYNVAGGLSTAVFGRDSLIIYAEHGTAPAVADATTTKFGARYTVYF